MRRRRADRDRQRADFGSRAQAQIDTEDITFGRGLGQDPHRLAGIALRRFARLVALPAGQRFGIVDQDRIDVGAVIELARAMFAKRQTDHPVRLRPRHAARDGGGDRGVERTVGKGRKLAHHAVEIEPARQVSDRQRSCQRQPLAPEGDAGILERLARRLGLEQRRFDIARLQQRFQIRQALQRARQEGRMRMRPCERSGPVGGR